MDWSLIWVHVFSSVLHSVSHACICPILPCFLLSNAECMPTPCRTQPLSNCNSHVSAHEPCCYWMHVPCLMQSSGWPFVLSCTSALRLHLEDGGCELCCLCYVAARLESSARSVILGYLSPVAHDQGQGLCRNTVVSFRARIKAALMQLNLECLLSVLNKWEQSL